MSNDPNDFLSGGGGQSAKFDEIGDTVSGVITDLKVVQQTDPDGNLKTWDNGDPRMQLVVTLDTGVIDGDDDGLRRLYVKGGNYHVASGEGVSMKDAVRDAVRAAGAPRIEVGGKLTVKHSGLGKKTSAAYSAPKLYKARYEVPVAAAVNVDDWD